MALLDLTRPLDDSLEIYRSEGYSDPDLVISPWCGVSETGFRVSRLGMGTQTGTHIDAPAHFLGDGATLEELAPEALVGEYLHVDLREFAPEKLEGRPDQRILFLQTGPSETEISEVVFSALLRLDIPVWVMAGDVSVAGRPAYFFNRRLAEAGVWLVEDLEPEAARQVPVEGRIAVLPLRLHGVSGSPCRVLVSSGPHLIF